MVDCGTGLLRLQKQFFDTGEFKEADVFFTHMHWDHVQGFAFFSPFFSSKCSFRFYGEKREGLGLREQLNQVFHAPVFPIGMDAFGAHFAFREITAGERLQFGEVVVDTIRLAHPNVCTGYRFKLRNITVCIVSDYEHVGDFPLSFAQNADILIYDAQYDESEYSLKKSWGHSTWQQGCRFAKQCGAKRLLLTHHDPFRSDEALEGLQALVDKALPGASFTYDGMTITLP